MRLLLFTFVLHTYLIKQTRRPTKNMNANTDLTKNLMKHTEQITDLHIAMRLVIR